MRFKRGTIRDAAAEEEEQRCSWCARPERGGRGSAGEGLAKENGGYRVWGRGEPHLEILFSGGQQPSNPGPEPFTDFVVRAQNRGRVLELLRVSQRPGVQQVLRTRDLTNTV